MYRPLVLAMLASTAHAADAELSIPHERYTLDNGLTVVLAQDRSNPIVHTQVWYHVGSKDEEQGLTGFAHLFEHLMFQGSKNSPGEYFTPIQQVGGDLNGTTNADRTNYFETVPSQYLPLALFMESDRMGALLPVLDLSKLDNQRDVVRNERRQRYENPPYGEAWKDLYATLFDETHPYHHPTIGSHADLEAATLDDVSSFFKTWYVPNNATLVVVGDFETDVAKALIEEQFGWIPRGDELEHSEVRATPLTEDLIIVQADDVPDNKLWMAWHSPAFYGDGDAALDIAASLLCDDKDSLLYSALVTEKGLARDVDCGQSSRKLDSAFVFIATAADGHTTEEVAAAIKEELEALAGGPPPPASAIEAAINQFEVGFYRRIQTIAGKGSLLSSYLYFRDDPDYLSRDLQRYLDLKPSEITESVKTWLTGPHAELHIHRKPAEEAE